MSLQQELHYGHFIDGQDYLGHTPESIDVINPANGEVYATMSMGDKGDVDAAVAAAKRAFNQPSWREMSNNDRGDLLFKCGQVIGAHAEELMFIESRDSGGTIRRAAGMDIPIVIDLIGYYADLIKTH
jgi:acyl-CoA reductase-like NAD-dependent aldehyde dehydrogenase